MRRSHVLILVVASLLLAGIFFGGCQKKSISSTQESQVSLKLWIKPGPGTQKAAVEFFQERVKRFEEKYPNIKIDAQVNPYSGPEYPQRLAAMIPGGQGPAAFRMYENSMHDYIESGYVADLTPFVNEWPFKDKVIFSLWGPAKVDGKTYGLPNDFYVKVLFYRRDLFTKAGLDPDKPPENWQELADYAVKLTNRSKNQYGFALVTGEKMSGWFFQDYVWQAGGEMMTQKDGKWRPAFASSPGADALQFYKDLRWKYNVIQQNVVASFSDLQNDFATGRLAMLVGDPGYYGSYKEKFGLTTEQMGMAPQPAGPTGIVANQRGGGYWCINAKASKTEQAAAWKWLEFITSKEEKIAEWKFKAEQGKLAPEATVYQDLQQSDHVNLPASWSEGITEAMNKSRPEPAAPHYMEVKGLTDEPIQKVLLDRKADPLTELKRTAAVAISKYYR
jgi:multiple sugar transport system substrate-binding protein